MNRRFFAFFIVLSMVVLLAGCGFSLESVDLGPLNGLLKNEPIVCSVLEKEDQQLKLVVLSSDGYYDVDDELLVSFSSISGGTRVNVGDSVTFSYDYLTDVTVRGDYPYSVVQSIQHTDFSPTEEATEE